ncbi:putative protein-serine/threonine phosphatase [Rosa chinensis]|uniref:RNA polymerase II C-terminal domain phosphatase-like n=1 Tax=Rosa chinensis TaxID=74649 RepID=A0A2P6QK45_ROSCH|nr:RNA polymerase II C-terminal domain phosphatase-like 4 [Rosa chinensis]PRQ34553.1 putative protein-serine/threonine phosphatase [Rosa chinensis]
MSRESSNDSPSGSSKALYSCYDDESENGISDRRKRHKVENSHGSSTTKNEIKDEDLEKINPQSHYYSNSSVGFDYIRERVRNHKDEIDRLRKANTNILLSCHKKLHLVIDLDHTLLNTTSLSDMSPEEEYLKTQTDYCLQNIDAFKYELPPKHKMTKLRPFVRTFLKEASNMFDMYIYTAGSRPYALKMVELLGKDYFGSRVISRDDFNDSSKMKCLELMHGKESAVLILDDNMDAWTRENQSNLILMRKYLFFKSKSAAYNRNFKTLSELKTDEIDELSQ